MNWDELPVNREQATVVVLVVGVVASAVLGPMFLLPSSPTDADGGHPTATPQEGQTYEYTEQSSSRPDEIPKLHQVPDSYTKLSTSSVPPPDVKASAGSQTMQVTVREEDGEPVIDLTDDRTHEGRWVALDTQWFNQTVGGTPNVAYIEHESGDTYASPIEVRGAQAVFYVKGFSTNTVTFDGTFNLSANPAQDGDSFSYNASDGGENLNINITGLTNSEWDNVTDTHSFPDESVQINVAGNTEPTGPSANNEPTVTFTPRTQYAYADPNEWLKYVNSAGTVVNMSVKASDVGAVGNFDSDGDVDIVYYDPNNNYKYVDTDGNVVDLGLDGFSPGPDMADLDGDGDKEVPVRSSNKIKLVDPAGNVQTISTGDSVYVVGGIEDIDGDGDLDIAYRDVDYVKYTDTAGNVVNTSQAAYGVGGVGDIDGDGDADIVYRDDANNVKYIDSSGNIVDTGQNGFSVGGMSDIDLDGEPEVAFKDTNNNVKYVNSAGSVTDTGEQGKNVGGVTGAVTDPKVDIDGDGTYEASVSGTLLSSETRELSSLNVSHDTATYSASGNGNVKLTFKFKEISKTTDPTIEVNGNTTSYSGTLADGKTVSLSTNDGWLINGTNTINVSAGGSLSADAPPAEVGLEYQHDIPKQKSVNYQGEAWSERYTVSRTWEEQTDNATLKIPWASDRVVAVRNVTVEYVDDTGTLQNTDSNPNYYFTDSGALVVELGDVQAGWKTTVDADGTKVQVQNGSISVVNPTAAGDELNSTISIESKSSGFAILVGGTDQGKQLHYVSDASYSADEQSVIYADGTHEVRLPNAASGDTADLKTLPLAFDVQTGEVKVNIPDGRVNTSEPVYRVRAGGTAGDAYDVTFVNAKDSTDYILYDETNDIVIDSGTASSPLTLSDDSDENRVIQFRLDSDGGGSGGDGGGGGSGGGAAAIVSANTQNGNYLPLALLGLALAGLFVVSRRETAVESAGESLGETTKDATQRLPVGGDAVGNALQSIVEGASRAVSYVLGNRYVAIGLGAALLLGAIQAGVIVLPQGSLVIVLVAGVGLGSLFVLREVDEFSMPVWVGINVSTALIALELVSDKGIIAAVSESDVAPVVYIGALYLGWKLIELIRKRGGGGGGSGGSGGDNTVTLQIEDGDST